MKTKLVLILFAVFTVISCDENYIDDISSVEQGIDTTAPTVTITNPTISKIIIPPTDNKSSINFEFQATDDIEIKSIAISLDGTQLASFDTFIDYRIASESYLYKDLPIGNHTVQVTAQDLSGKSSNVSFPFLLTNVYEPLYSGEIFYMPFEADRYMDFVSTQSATVVGSPGFANGKIGKAYSGAKDAYLTFPTSGLTGNQFSAAFWYKINANPDRSGILTIGPPDPNNTELQNNRTSGFRFFREGGAANQTFKLNVGTGAGDSWFDGGAAATINPTVTTSWVHLAFTISASTVTVYIDGKVVSQGSFPGVNWSGCDILSIGSGAPRFTEWNHLSDLSLYDELRLFNKALTLEEVKAVMDGD